MVRQRIRVAQQERTRRLETYCLNFKPVPGFRFRRILSESRILGRVLQKSARSAERDPGGG